MINIGEVSYAKIGGKWKRSPFTPQQVTQMAQEVGSGAKHTCQYVRDEVMNGEPALVYQMHSEKQDLHITVDDQIWVSKSRGLPLRQETELNSDGARKHLSRRFEYGDVQAPRLEE